MSSQADDIENDPSAGLDDFSNLGLVKDASLKSLNSSGFNRTLSPSDIQEDSAPKDPSSAKSKYAVTRDTCSSPNSYAAIHKKLRASRKGTFYGQTDPNEIVKRSNNELTLQQLREIIEHVSEEYDESCHEPGTKKPVVTMEYQLYDFLRKHYSLKSAIKEKAGLVFRAIRRYAPKENDVAVFGKILQNTLPVSFKAVQDLLSSTCLAQLRQQLEERYPKKPGHEIDALWSVRLRSGFPLEECIDVVRFMYNDKDSEEIIIRVEHASNLAASSSKNHEPIQKDCVRLKDFLHIILTYQMNLTEFHLSDFIQIFHQVNRDHSGVLTNDELQELVRRVGYLDAHEDGKQDNDDSAHGTVLLDATAAAMATVRRYKKGATFSQSADLLAGQISARCGAVVQGKVA